jgi:hypothetical protein
MPERIFGVYSNDATPDEQQRLLAIRSQTLDRVAEEALLTGPVKAADRVGWRAVIKIRGRDTDGSLYATVTVTAPHLAKPYVRKVRLVSKKALPYDLC